MDMRNSIAVDFHCTLTSPFHTTQRKYQNLLKCAPYILGTTLRGAILGYLIENHCDKAKIEQLKRIVTREKIAEFHRTCEQHCPIKEFFQKDTDIQFSFGNFRKEIEYTQTTRIALRREFRTASEGAIVNVECIQGGTGFDFEVILFENLMEYKKEIREAVEFAGRYKGIGCFKSVGFGRYTVNEVKEIDLSAFPETVDWKNTKNPVKIYFDTPLVFRIDRLDEELIAETISLHLLERCQEVVQQPELRQLELKDLSFHVRPEFVHRYSLEVNQRENKLVLDAGSMLKFDVKNLDDNALFQFEIGSRFGVGEWRNYGFGKFLQRWGEYGGAD